MSKSRWFHRRLLPAVGAGIALLIVVGVANAHDFWLVPDAFLVAEGGWVEARGQTSSRFPRSESAVAIDRVADARLIAAGGSERIMDLSHSGASLLLRHRPTIAGQRVVAIALHWRSARESAAGFRRYLELEGAPEALARIEREGLLRGRDSVTRRYAKYAKTFVEVLGAGGARGARAFGVAAGHPLEFVPLSDPSDAKSGDTLRIRLLYAGMPLASAPVHAGYVTNLALVQRAARDSAERPTDVHLTTDSGGIVRVPLSSGGLWNVRTIHVVPAPANSGADWDTHWATGVFLVAGPTASPRSTSVSSDSVAVTGVIERYHRALGAGDSATALGLLAENAIVLESGGAETREEYRSHHLPADISFARAIPTIYVRTRVEVVGDMAWVASTSTTQGEFRGRVINSAGAELMVLTRTPAGWKISAIHWSSRARRQ